MGAADAPRSPGGYVDRRLLGAVDALTGASTSIARGKAPSALR